MKIIIKRYLISLFLFLPFVNGSFFLYFDKEPFHLLIAEFNVFGELIEREEQLQNLKQDVFATFRLDIVDHDYNQMIRELRNCPDFIKKIRIEKSILRNRFQIENFRLTCEQNENFCIYSKNWDEKADDSEKMEEQSEIEPSSDILHSDLSEDLGTSSEDCMFDMSPVQSGQCSRIPESYSKKKIDFQKKSEEPQVKIEAPKPQRRIRFLNNLQEL